MQPVTVSAAIFLVLFLFVSTPAQAGERPPDCVHVHDAGPAYDIHDHTDDCEAWLAETVEDLHDAQCVHLHQDDWGFYIHDHTDECLS